MSDSGFDCEDIPVSCPSWITLQVIPSEDFLIKMTKVAKKLLEGFMVHTIECFLIVNDVDIVRSSTPETVRQ